MTKNEQRRAAANDEAFARLVAARPRLVGAALAGDLVPELRARRVHHAGPPIAFAEMCPVMQGALACAVMLEGWAPDAEAALALLAEGAVETGANNDHGTVGPMAGPVSASTPVWIVEEERSGAVVVTPFHEGFGRAQCMGSTSEETLDRLRRTGEQMVPVVDAALRAGGGIDLHPWVAEAILRGDELHNRCVAATSMLVERLALYGMAAGVDGPALSQALEVLAANGQTAATPVMAWAKSMLDRAADVPGSSIVTAYARNGRTVGLKLSGTGDRWFTAPGLLVRAQYLDGFSDADATLDIGDSAAAEIGGVGAFVMAASPAFARKVGETPAEGVAHTLSMYALCHGESRDVKLPALDWRGAPLGIDAAKVVAAGVAPIHNTAVANKEAGAGIVGTGMVRGAMECYEQAMSALAEAPVAA